MAGRRLGPGLPWPNACCLCIARSTVCRRMSRDERHGKSHGDRRRGRLSADGVDRCGLARGLGGAPRPALPSTSVRARPSPDCGGASSLLGTPTGPFSCHGRREWYHFDDDGRCNLEQRTAARGCSCLRWGVGKVGVAVTWRWNARLAGRQLAIGRP